MSSRILTWLAVCCSIVWPAAALAQAAADLDILQRGVVLVRSPRASGSGFVVAASPGRVTVVTARHVVEGKGERPAGSLVSDHRPCDNGNSSTVQFYLDDRDQAVAAAICSDTFDVAALHVVTDSASRREFPTFREPALLGDARAAVLTVLGVPEGRAWGVSVGNVVQAANEETITTTGPGVRDGFSGGPVVDLNSGLVGMVVRASHVTHSVPRATIDALLNRWQIQSDRLENAKSGRPNPGFADPRPQDFAVEGARNAIRQYRLALTRKQRDALLQVYPALGRSSVDALFGDALRIDLDLQDCSQLNEADEVTCEFAMTIYRRTGRAETLKSRGVNAPGGPGAFPRMKFALKKDPEAINWNITEILLEKEAQ